jgi:hypothetical protein
MAVECVANDISPEKTANIIMRTLPVCKERRISYSTFSIVDVNKTNEVRMIEYDNPPAVFVRGAEVEELRAHEIRVKRRRKSEPPRETVLRCNNIRVQAGDRLVLFSDGVTQSGMGSRLFPLGWTRQHAVDFIRAEIARDAEISSRELSRRLVGEAMQREGHVAKDDITCAVLHFREPRRLLILTGPPFDPQRDREVSLSLRDFPGSKIVCGGTTAAIVSRELGRPTKVQLKYLDPVIPPTSEMEGMDLVTEGIITLGRVAELLESGEIEKTQKMNAARLAAEMMLECDVIEFLVGTRINEAHQDPTMPVELDIRRNVIKKIAQALRQKYVKEVHIRFV